MKRHIIIVDDYPNDVNEVRNVVDLQIPNILGMQIFSGLPFEIKSSPQVEIPLLQELEIPSPFLEVLECTKIADSFISYFSFIGLPETHLKKIRTFCQNLTAKSAIQQGCYL